MTYEVSNLPKKVHEELFHKAVLHALEFLKLDVDFEIIFETLSRHQCGFVDFEDDEEFAEISVYIAKRLSPKEAIRTLFHELVHVKQYVEGRLVTEGEVNRWEGIVWIDKYENLPWEVEAFKLEEEIMNSFTERTKNVL